MTEFENLEAGKTYELTFQLKGLALTNPQVIQKVLAKIYTNALQLSNKLKIIKTDWLPNFENRKELKITVQTLPIPEPVKTEELSLAPLIIPLALITTIILGGGVLGYMTLTKIKEISPQLTPVITGTKDIVKWFVIGAVILFVLPQILKMLPKGRAEY